MIETIFLGFLKTHQEHLDETDALRQSAAWFGQTYKQRTENPVLQAFAAYLAGPFADALDRYPDTDDAFLSKLFKSFSRIEISQKVQTFIQDALGKDAITIQSARELTAEKKRQLRNDLQKNEPNAFAAYRVDRGLLGGLRLFKKGSLIDRTWRGTVKRLLTTT